MYMKRIINKVPGNIPTEPKKEKQGYIGDLTEKTTVQLKELLERQKKLLANKSFINKLADKGEKISKLKITIEEELKKRDEGEKLSKMLSAFSMNGKEDLDALEWTGRCCPGQVAQDDEADPSDDETDPLKILATHSGAGFHKKKTKVLKPEESLIKPSDLTVESQDKEIEELDEYAKHLCERLEAGTASAQSKQKFMPNRTLKQQPPQANSKKMGKYWEVTAATPPPPVHGDTKLVSLQDSIRLQSEQQQKLKEIQMKHAVERLGAWQNGRIGRLPDAVGSYRDPASRDSSEEEQSDHEVHDEEYPDGGGVVIYNLVDDTND